MPQIRYILQSSLKLRTFLRPTGTIKYISLLKCKFHGNSMAWCWVLGLQKQKWVRFWFWISACLLYEWSLVVINIKKSTDYTMLPPSQIWEKLNKWYVKKRVQDLKVTRQSNKFLFEMSVTQANSYTAE